MAPSRKRPCQTCPGPLARGGTEAASEPCTGTSPSSSSPAPGHASLLKGREKDSPRPGTAHRTSGLPRDLREQAGRLALEWATVSAVCSSTAPPSGLCGTSCRKRNKQAQGTGESLWQMPLSDWQVETQLEGLSLPAGRPDWRNAAIAPPRGSQEPALGIKQPGSGSSHPSQEASSFPHRWEGGSPDKKSVMFRDPIISKLLPALCVAEGGNKRSWFLLFKTHWDVSLAFQSRP